MKKILVTLFLFFLYISASFSQDLYSKENLEKASSEDLFFYLTKAQKLERTGGILLIAVPVSAVSGIVLANNSYGGGTAGAWSAGLGLVIASLGFTVVGIPTFAVGTSRVKKVTNLLRPKYNTAIIDFFPGCQYSYHTQNVQPGITFRIRF